MGHVIGMVIWLGSGDQQGLLGIYSPFLHLVSPLFDEAGEGCGLASRIHTSMLQYHRGVRYVLLIPPIPHLQTLPRGT